MTNPTDPAADDVWSEPLKVWANSMMAYGGAEYLKNPAPEHVAAIPIKAYGDQREKAAVDRVVAWLRGMSASEWNAMMQGKMHMPWVYGVADAIARGAHKEASDGTA